MVKGRAAFDYAVYVSVVKCVAANYDNRHSFKQSKYIQQVHQINIHDEENNFSQMQDPMGNDMEEIIGTFCSVCIHEASQNPCRDHRRPSFCREVWNSLSAEDQSAWHKLFDKLKKKLCLHLNSAQILRF